MILIQLILNKKMENIKLGIGVTKLDVETSGKSKLKKEMPIKKETIQIENEQRRELKKSKVLAQEKFSIIKLEDINTFLEYKNNQKKNSVQ